MSLSSPVAIPISATRNAQRDNATPSARSPWPTTTGTSAPAHSRSNFDLSSSFHTRSPSQPNYSPRARQSTTTSRPNGSSRTQPNSPTSATAAGGRPRAIDLAALPSFSHSLSEFANMGIVPGDILSGCLRTGTAKVCKEKLDHVLAANNKVLGPNSSSSEDEFSSYSSDSHYPTIRRRPFPGLTPIHAVSPTTPSRPAFNHHASSDTSTSSGSSNAPRVPASMSASFKSVGKNTSLTIDPRTANALLKNQSSCGTDKYQANGTPGLSSPPPLIESRGYASDSSPGALPTPHNGFTDQASAHSAATNYFPPTSSSIGRDAHGSESDSDAAVRSGTTSNTGTIRLNRRVSGKSPSVARSGSRSASRTPRTQRSPEREKVVAGAPSVPPLPVSIGSPVSGQLGQREREAAMFKNALERVQRKGSVRRVRPPVRATFELSSESGSDEE